MRGSVQQPNVLTEAICQDQSGQCAAHQITPLDCLLAVCQHKCSYCNQFIQSKAVPCHMQGLLILHSTTKVVHCVWCAIFCQYTITAAYSSTCMCGMQRRAGAKGFGLFACEDLQPNQFIIEYIGEVGPLVPLIMVTVFVQCCNYILLPSAECMMPRQGTANVCSSPVVQHGLLDMHQGIICMGHVLLLSVFYYQYNSTAQHSTAQLSTAQHSTAQHGTAQHGTAQHGTAQHGTAWHSTA